MARWLDEAVALFPFPDPHLQRSERVRFLREHCVEDTSRMGQLSDQAIGASGQVFALLVEFVRQNQGELGLV